MRNLIFKYKFWGLAVLFIGLTTSCSEDFLNVTEDDTIGLELFYKSEADVKAAAFGVYELLNDNDPFERYHAPGRTVWSDDATSNSYGEYGQLESGTFSASFGKIEQYWGFFYKMIRRANSFLESVDAVDMDVALRDRYKGEVRFLRAFAYQELAFLYGDVPLITTSVSPDESRNISRTPKAEVMNFVVSELEAISNDLPSSYSGVDVGRVTKGAADALLCRVQLFEENYAASVAAAQQVISGGAHDLETNFEDIFKLENENNEEVIFDVQYLTSGWDLLNAQQLYFLPGELGGWGNVAPSQSLVDEFEMSNGLAINDPGSGYDPNDPFANRDPRLNTSIIFPGEVVNGTIVDSWTDAGGNPTSPGTGETGYWTQKFYNASLPNNVSGTNYILIRYAEVLLNLAEASNELSGPSTEVYNAINQVRARAGMPDLPAGLTQLEMRDRIRHERRVELAFEGDRFYAIRRWGIAHEVMPAGLYGSVNPATGENIEVIAPGNTQFEANKHYLWPIPQSQIDLSNEGVITQNPNW
ncbi:RagB/SusD family nutrient uptake outer membrane protein [Seonamhaeicola sp.]|uniref:RagB/SusD family nutrient uptake outer membrane protein n=1 Tax=Seonamhaeicola sp. TaxID=1912245 RepID=UPI0026379320|nr:RagB/SusD family nutrient uptake outer membrane protein [Seonamhaeicola sp.]